MQLPRPDLILAAALAAAWAVEPAGPLTRSAGPAATRPVGLIQDVAGVYKKRFENGLVDGTKFISENILEIVPYGEDTAYFRVHLEFFNGHVCAAFGIVRQEAEKLVFEDPGERNYQGRQCRLELSPGPDGIEFNDVDRVCRTMVCGERGGFSGVRFDRRARRKIRYLNRLKSSREYRQAVWAFERSRGASPGKPPPLP